MYDCNYVHVQGAWNVLSSCGKNGTVPAPVDTTGCQLTATGCLNSRIAGYTNKALSCTGVDIAGSFVNVAKQDYSFIWSGVPLFNKPDTAQYGYAVDESGDRVSKFGNGAFAVNP